MKFKVDRQEFHRALGIVEGIIPSREIRSIISNIHIEAEKDRAILTATDLEMGIKTSLAVQTEEKGKITLPAKKLSQSIREFRGTQIALHSDADNHVTIQDPSGGSKAKITLMGSPSEEFPIISTMPENKFVPFPPEITMEMIRKTSYSIAEEDSRYVFNGLFVINQGANVSFVGTDGRRLAKIQRAFPSALPFTEGVILPNKAVRELSKLLDSTESGGVAYDEKERRIHFRIGGVDLICKLIDGQFPDYRQVIPQKLSSTLKLSRTQFENSLRQVAVMASEPTRQVRVGFGPSQISFSASTPDLGEAQDNMPSDYSGEEMVIAFNSNYLLDVIRVINVDEFNIGFSSSSSPVVIQDPSDPDFIAVIMPMKI